MEKMKSRKKTKTPSESNQISKFKDIPPEVWSLIFAPFPVETLVQFRWVCKFWCSVIDDPDFISMHSKLCKSNSDKSKLFAIEALGRRGSKGAVMTIRLTETLRKTAQILKSPDDVYFILGRCKGLFLMRRYFDFGIELRLCNLSIRKSLLLPPCPLPRSLSDRTDNIDKSIYALGFSPSANDYKVIGIIFGKSEANEPTDVYVAVYTLRDKKWALRNNGMNMSFWYSKRMFKYHDEPPAYVYLEGVAHWIGNDPYDEKVDKPTHLVSFDFDKENFTYMELPFAFSENETFRFVFHLGESLAIFNISSVCTSIWVLDNEKRVWNQWFSGNSSYAGFNIFRRREGFSPVLYYEKDGRYLIYGKKSYNIATCEVKLLGKSMSNYVFLEMYSESLVLCKGYGAEDMTSFA